MQNESLLRAFDVCLQQVLKGSPPEQAIEIYPQWQNELLQPLEAAQALNVFAGQIGVPVDAQSASRAGFTGAAAGLRNRANFTEAVRGRRKLLAGLLIAVLAVAFLIGGAFLTSSALPNSPLFPVKELVRAAGLRLAASPGQRLELEYALDAARLAEVRKLAGLARPAAVSFSIGIQDMQGDVWNTDGLTFRITPETQIIGQVQPGYYNLISGNVTPDGIVEVARIQPREYIIPGVLQRIDAEKALITGIPVQLTPETILLGAPQVGDAVILHALKLLDGRLSARLIERTAEEKQ